MKRTELLSMMIVAGLVLTAVAPGAAQQAQDHRIHRETGRQAVDPTEYPPELLEQLEEVRTATERFRDHRVALTEGYEHVGGDGPLMGEHWVRHDLTDRPFDIFAPSTLQYLKIDGEYVLAGVAYTVYRAAGDPLPEGFAGDADVWHLHDLMKISMAATEGRPLLRWIAERRIANDRTRWDKERPELTMVHAWTWLENPDGVFAQDHRLIPYVRLGLPDTWGINASIDAASGVALAGDGACRLEVRKTSFLAGAGWRQRRELASACGDAKASVRVALEAADTSDDRVAAGDALNAAAQEAWRAYVARRTEILTEQQIARLAIGIEHPDGHRH